MFVMGLNNYNNPFLNNWYNMPVSFDPFAFQLPPLLQFGVPRYDSNNWNFFGFTPPTNFCITPSLNYNTFNFYNPFSFLNGHYTQTTNNPFDFLNTSQSSSTSRTQNAGKTKKKGNYVSEEILSGKEVLKLGNGVNLNNLKQDLKNILVRLDKKAKELGYTLVVSDGYRTHAQQIEAKRNKPSLAATPGKSPHEYGAAIDIALYKDGKQVNIANVPEFSNFAKQIGLSWGNDWKSKKEPWHFELAQWRNRSDIAPEYRERTSTIA